jgi:hypothetical protein
LFCKKEIPCAEYSMRRVGDLSKFQSVVRVGRCFIRLCIAIGRWWMVGARSCVARRRGDLRGGKGEGGG